jgi:hypothetical protein
MSRRPRPDLQETVTESGGTAAGSTGYDHSRGFIARTLRKANYRVSEPINVVEGWVENSARSRT